MRIGIFGAGSVGLVQAAILADVSHEIVCVDTDAARIESLRQGGVPLHEPGLAELLRRGLDSARLRFTTDAALAVAHGEVLFVAVGTPSTADGAADPIHVLQVADAVGEHMKEGRFVVVKSTVPVGTCDRVAERIAERLQARGRTDIAVEVVSNPEFLKEGTAVADCARPDRIVIGTGSAAAEKVLRELYAPFNRNREKIIVMDRRSAELTKYAANCMLAAKISLMNEIAGLADILGADIEQVRRGIGSDPRIGSHFIYAGIGYGGSCLPKDMRALIGMAAEHDFDPAVLKAVEQRNERQKLLLVERIRGHFGGDLSGRKFALWGLSFKPNTDDMREAPSRAIMEALWAAGAAVRAYDPQAMPQCRRLYPGRDDLILCATRDEALTGADALILATEWKEFRVPPYGIIRERLREPVIFDGRNLYDPATAARHGLRIVGVGRRS